MVLVFLTVIPSLALLGLWGLNTAQLGLDWQRLAQQDALTDQTAALARNVTTQLQEERRITGGALASNHTSPTAELTAQRRRTDTAVKAFQDATDGELSSLLRKQLRDALVDDRNSLTQVKGIRTAIDEGTITAEISFQSFTGVIESNLAYFEALGNADNGELVAAFKPLTDLMWADEMLSREDAVLTYSWAADEIRDVDQSNFSQWIGTQNFLLESEITPRLTNAERLSLQDLQGNDAWNTKLMVEAILARHHPVDPTVLPFTSSEWRQAMTTVQPLFTKVIEERAAVDDSVTKSAVHDLQVRVWTYAVICLGSVIIVITLSVLLTGSLRRRILALRDEAARLETELPGVMERLRSGEDVDVDTEVREVAYRDDEMGRLGQALNLARRTAVETAVRETEQHRGFQRMLQRIARRTQLLIGLQLKKLDEMERGQEDPEILEGLFDLDHLTSRLRRYEENLVVLGGGQPQRRWRKPVRVVDVLRAALGEVQDYRRIRIEVADGLWLSGRAVGPLVHILAELMENAAAFSRPPSPVEARATMAVRGLAVEIEDRGLGMEPEDYDRINLMMTDPPELDVVSRAEDARLGLYVVSRLASGLGLQVEFRPSVYGGARVIVMVPGDLVAQPPGEDSGQPAVPAQARHTGAAAGSAALSGVPSGGRDPGAPNGSQEPDTASAPAAPVTGLTAAPAPWHAEAPEYGGASNQVAASDASGRREERGGPGQAGPRHPRKTPHTDQPAAPDHAAYAQRAGHQDQAPYANPIRAEHARAEHARAEHPPTEDVRAESAQPAAPAPPYPSWAVRTPPADPPRASETSAGVDGTRSAGLPGLPGRSRGRALEQALSGADGPTDDLNPLPKRVRQANLAPGLKEPPKRSRRSGGDEPPDPADGARSARSGAAIGAFQRQSRLTRDTARPAESAPGEDRAPAGEATPQSRSNHTEDAP